MPSANKRVLAELAAVAGMQATPQEFDENNLPQVKRVIAVLSGKGSGGKSLVTGAFSIELAQAGHKVGILDANITDPSIPKMVGMRGRHAMSLGNLLLPEVSEHGVKVLSRNLLLKNESDPEL